MPAAAQGLFVILHVGQGAEQQGDVAGPHRPRAGSASSRCSPTRSSRPSRASRGAAGRSNRPRAAAAARLGPSSVDGRFALRRSLVARLALPRVFLRLDRPKELDGRRGADLRAWTARSGSYSGPNSSPNRALTKSSTAGWLRKFSDSGNRPVGGNLLAKLLEHVRIGPAEAIDRLLEVAHEEQLPVGEPAVAEGLDQLHLQRIGVLEFIDQQQPGLRGQPLPQVGAVRAGSRSRARISRSLKSSAASSRFSRLVGRGHAVGDGQQPQGGFGGGPGGLADRRPASASTVVDRLAESLRRRRGRRRKPLRWPRPFSRRRPAPGRFRGSPPGSPADRLARRPATGRAAPASAVAPLRA